MRKTAMVAGVFALTLGCQEFTPSATVLGDGTLRVDTAPGVTLEVVDWGGEGTPLVLLAGGGSTAHSYDDFAPSLTDQFRVVGITRRGVGASVGSSPSRLRDHVDDVAAVIRALGMDRAVVVGHSFAGMELPLFGRRHPELCRGLVYLDAAYDYTDPELGRVLTEAAPRSAPEPTDDDLASVEAYRAWSMRIQEYAMPASEIRARRVLDDSGAIVGIAPSTSTEVAPRAPRWDDVSCPSLGLYPVVTPLEEWLPYYRERFDALGPDERAEADRYVEAYGAWTEAQRAVFGALPHNDVVEFPGRGHFFFLTHPEEVTSAVRAWVEQTD